MSIYIGKSSNEADLVSGGGGGASLNPGTALLRKGFIMSSEPQSPINGDLWISSSSLPDSFPVSGVKIYQDNAWKATSSYSPSMYDIWINYTTDEGYINYFRDVYANKWVQLGGDGSSSDYLPLAGGTLTGTVYSQSLIPMKDNTYDLGSTTAKYRNIYATTFIGDLTGNSSSADKLKTGRNIIIQDATAANSSSAVAFDGSKDVNLKLPAKIKATLDGNATTASKLAMKVKISGVDFDGSSGITLKTSGITNDSHYIPSNDDTVKNVVAMTKSDFDSKSSSLPEGTVVAITDGGYVTTQATGLTCDLPLDL